MLSKLQLNPSLKVLHCNSYNRLRSRKLLQPRRQLRGQVGHNKTGAGAFERVHRLQRHGLLVDPPLRGGGLELGVFARDMVHTHRHPSQRLGWRDDGSLDFSVRVDGLGEISWWILGYGPFAEVVAPEILLPFLRH